MVRNFLSSRNSTSNPAEEWNLVAKVINHSPFKTENDCPKRAFLGLCAIGLVKGICPGPYTESVNNKTYVNEAVRLLKTNPALANIGTTSKLWTRVLDSLGIAYKKHNQQMNVVLELWERKYIIL